MQFRRSSGAILASARHVYKNAPNTKYFVVWTQKSEFSNHNLISSQVTGLFCYTSVTSYQGGRERSDIRTLSVLFRYSHEENHWSCSLIFITKSSFWHKCKNTYCKIVIFSYSTLGQLDSARGLHRGLDGAGHHRPDQPGGPQQDAGAHCGPQQEHHCQGELSQECN